MSNVTVGMVDDPITTTTATPDLECVDGASKNDEELYQTIRWWMDGTVHIIICTIGFIANLVSIRVLLLKQHTSIFYKTLAVLAMCDALFTLLDVAESVRMMHHSHDSCLPMSYYQKIHIHLFPHFFRPVRSIAMVSSIYITCVIAFERYFAVSKPISTFVRDGVEPEEEWKTVLKYTIPVILLSILVSFPKFFEFYVEDATSLCDSGSKVDELNAHTSTTSLRKLTEGKLVLHKNRS